VITKLLHTRYRVEDLEKTVSFYRDVLGLQEVRRHTSGRGSQLVFMKAPGSQEEIELCKYDESGPVKVGPDLTHLAFEVENMEEFARHTAAKGYPLSDGPHRTQGGDSIAFIDAPEGYEVELIERNKK
jgi:lactoylglutathione lyase